MIHMNMQLYTCMHLYIHSYCVYSIASCGLMGASFLLMYFCFCLKERSKSYVTLGICLLQEMECFAAKALTSLAIEVSDAY